MHVVPPKPQSAEGVDSLLESARTGSVQSLGFLLEMCRSYLLGIANGELESQLQPKAGASDVVQEALVEAQRIFARFHGHSHEELFAWIRAILLNKLADLDRSYHGTEKRRLTRERALDASGEGRVLRENLRAEVESPSWSAINEEQRQAIRQALQRLPDEYRQVIVWHEWDNESFERIGERLGRTPGAARAIWWRALKQLEQQLVPEL